MNDRTGGALPSIIAHARAGALDRAWALFEALGASADDPAAMAVKGRLLKDRALRASGDARTALYREAAEAYWQAGAGNGSTYPLINAATLSLLAGDASAARLLAEEALDRVRRHPDEPETPYYRAATVAEAELLLGRAEEARKGLTGAIALAPQAWEDHASTLRQFAAILAAQGSDAAWLDALRPPRSLHFGGHMSFRAGGDHGALAESVAATLIAERIGFGFGALAAGADIIIAEALLARDAELHLFLPGGVAHFAALSVDPFGAGWRRRFDAALDRAETVRAVAPVDRPPDRCMLGIADEVAMGAALAHARRLASEAVQLLVLPEAGEDTGNRAGAIWKQGDSARRQYLLTAPREDAALPSRSAVPEESRCLAALAIRPAGGEAIAGRLDAIKAALEREPMTVSPAFTGEMVVAGFADPVAAARSAVAIAALGGGETVGGHYGVADLVDDPFSGGPRVSGRMLAVIGAAAISAVPGSICVSDDFAAALEVKDPFGFRSEPIGELNARAGEAPVGLHALRATL